MSATRTTAAPRRRRARRSAGLLAGFVSAVLCTFVDGPGCDLIKTALKSPAAGRAAPFAGEVKAKPRVTEPIDKSLGGIMEVTK